MRVVGGIWKGHPLEAPQGRSVTRPTTDRVREALASMMESAFGLDLSGRHVLDAFGGSGAFGIEMLSRGMEEATFIDQDRKAAARIKQILRENRLNANARFVDMSLSDKGLQISRS